MNYYEKNKEARRAYQTAYTNASPERHLRLLWLQARARCRKTGREFSIPFEELVVVTHCPLLELPLDWCKHGRGNKKINPASPSLDRVDSQKGYVSGNVRVISYLANMMKASATGTQIKTFCQNAGKYLDSLT